MSTSIFNETFQHTEQSEDVDLLKKHSVFHPKHLKIIVLFFFFPTDSIEKKQETSPSEEEGVKLVDASKQRHQDDGTAGMPESLSERPQPPTEPLVSLLTVCLVSAAALTLILHTSHHLLTCCLCRY